jgi:hypothetical protein
MGGILSRGLENEKGADFAAPFDVENTYCCLAYLTLQP